jgi:hypothetical protein
MPILWAQAVLLARHSTNSPWFIAIVLLLAVGLSVYGWYASAKRRRELTAWAAARGLSFTEGRVDDFDRKYPEFGCLQRGENRYASNLIRGRWGEREILGFDYHYVIHSGKNRHTHVFSAMIVTSHIPLQPLHIRPENIFDKVTEFFGADDIDFESAEFSRKFFVKALDKRWAYDVIHPRVMEFLLASPHFNIEFGLISVMAYRQGLFKPADFEAACQVVAGILDQLPEYVVRQQGQLRPREQGEV